MSAQDLGSQEIIGRMFLRLRNGPMSWVMRIAMKIDSDRETERHRWLGMSPAMREWVGGRLAVSLRSFGIDITNLDYEATIEVLVREMRREAVSQLVPRINSLVDRAMAQPARLLSTDIINGESLLSYDGFYLFDTARSEGDSGSWANLLSIDISGLPVQVAGATTRPSPEEASQVIMQCIETMYGFNDDRGEPINELARNFLVMTPVSLYGSFLAGASLQTFAGAGQSVLAPLRERGITIEVVPNPRLTFTESVVVARADAMEDGVAPFILQEEVPIEVAAKAEGSEYEFDNKAHQYGVNWSGATGPGFPQMIVKATMT